MSARASRSPSPDIPPLSTEFTGAFASRTRPNSAAAAASERTPLVAPADPAGVAAVGPDGKPLTAEQVQALREAKQRAKWIALGAAAASGVAVVVGAALYWMRRDHAVHH